MNEMVRLARPSILLTFLAGTSSKRNRSLQRMGARPHARARHGRTEMS